MLHNFVRLHSGITLGCVLGALLGSTTPLSGLFPDVCAKCHYVCLYSGFLWCWIQIYRSHYLKLNRPPFLDVFHSPWGLLGLNIPQNAHFDQKRPFLAHMSWLICSTFPKFRQNTSVMSAQYKLRNFGLAKSLVWEPQGYFRAIPGPGMQKWLNFFKIFCPKIHFYPL